MNALVVSGASLDTRNLIPNGSAAPQGEVLVWEILTELSESRTKPEHRRLLAGGGCRVLLVLGANNRRCAAAALFETHTGHGVFRPRTAPEPQLSDFVRVLERRDKICLSLP